METSLQKCVLRGRKRVFSPGSLWKDLSPVSFLISASSSSLFVLRSVSYWARASTKSSGEWGRRRGMTHIPPCHLQNFQLIPTISAECAGEKFVRMVVWPIASAHHAAECDDFGISSRSRRVSFYFIRPEIFVTSYRVSIELRHPCVYPVVSCSASFAKNDSWHCEISCASIIHYASICNVFISLFPTKDRSQKLTFNAREMQWCWCKETPRVRTSFLVVMRNFGGGVSKRYCRLSPKSRILWTLWIHGFYVYQFLLERSQYLFKHRRTSEFDI